jgi:hypothetical protein
MAEPSFKRRLAAILSADVEGYIMYLRKHKASAVPVLKIKIQFSYF